MNESVWILASSLTVERHGGVEFEVRQLRLPHQPSRNAIRRLLTEQAEYGGWELMRLRRYRDGTRDAWLRRRVIRVRATLN
ncbi:MAG TPA: DUF5703 family protein [Propionibacteriaceae bacterium]|nr:DUF5703 family protein [Propionibacteriaceae bacterium]